MANNLYAVPLSKRPPPGPWDYIRIVVFNIFFGLSMLAIHTLQLFNLVFRIFPATVSLYNSLVNWHKDVSSTPPVTRSACMISTT